MHSRDDDFISVALQFQRQIFARRFRADNSLNESGSFELKWLSSHSAFPVKSHPERNFEKARDKKKVD